MEVEVSCHYIRRVRLSDVPLQQCGQQHPFRAVLPLSGDIVLGALNVALTEKMTCFSVWVAQNQQNIPKIVIVTEIHSAFSVSITFSLHCEFAPVLVMASQRLQLSVLQSVCRVSLDGMATLGRVRGVTCPEIS